METYSEGQLRQAMDNGAFFLHYQPKIDMRTLRVIGAEALARCRTPGGELMRAAQFMELMEQTGLIVELGDRVMGMACRQLRAWREKGLTPCRVSVNISQRQFRQPDFLERMRDHMRKEDILPHLLGIEIKESAAVNNPEEFYSVLYELEEMGVVVSVDNFGSGILGQADLERFPLHMIKIDRPFTAGLPDDVGCQAVVLGTLAIAEALQVMVLAEGVETREQFDYLRDAGCNQAQGYLFSRAVTPEGFEDFLVNPDISGKVL